MAITPRSFLRNPLLLFCLIALALPAAAVLMCSGTCPSQRQADQTEVARVHVQSSERVAQQEAHRQAARHTETDGQGWLGVRILTLNAKRARHAGVEPTRGVLVLDLQDGMPAQTAGFAPYDVVTHFAGQPTLSTCQLKKKVSAAEPGTRVPVRVIRDGVPVVLYPTLTSHAAAPACGCGK